MHTPSVWHVTAETAAWLVLLGALHHCWDPTPQRGATLHWSSPPPAQALHCLSTGTRDRGLEQLRQAAGRWADTECDIEEWWEGVHRSMPGGRRGMAPVAPCDGVNTHLHVLVRESTM